MRLNKGNNKKQRERMKNLVSQFTNADASNEIPIVSKIGIPTTLEILSNSGKFQQLLQIYYVFESLTEL